jgi:hypothetical protein
VSHAQTRSNVEFNRRGELINEIGESEVVKMFTAIAYGSLLVCVMSVIFAITGVHQFYWISAVGIYVFSFIAGSQSVKLPFVLHLFFLA